MKASFAAVATQGGVGEGRLHRAEADLDNAQEDLAKAKANIVTERTAKVRPRARNAK